MQGALRGVTFSILGAIGPAVLGCVPAGGQDSSGDMEAPAENQSPVLPSVPRLLFDITGIVGTGQSLSVGVQGTTFSGPATQPNFNNLKLALGGARVPLFDPNLASLSLVPLVDPIRPSAIVSPSAYPANLYGETLHAAMAAQITTMARRAGASDYVTAHTVVGESGQGMSVINKAAVEVVTGSRSTGRAYAATLFETSAITRLATAAGRTYGIGAIVLTHGETDAGNSGYEAAMIQLWSDYNLDLKAITQQTETIPLITSQQHSFPFSAGQRTGASLATLAEWKIGVNHPGDFICAGPKYQYPYAADNVHLVTRGYELLGEKYGEVFFQRVVLGNSWQPLQPTGVTRSGRVVTVRFHVPVPPLVWDTVLPMPHQGPVLAEWAHGRGFELRTGSTALAIHSVQIVGDTVQIAAAAKLPAVVTVGYAATSDGLALPGVSRRWGTLVDSDPVVGAFTGEAQPNYAVAFELGVP